MRRNAGAYATPWDCKVSGRRDRICCASAVFIQRVERRDLVGDGPIVICDGSRRGFLGARDTPWISPTPLSSNIVQHLTIGREGISPEQAGRGGNPRFVTTLKIFNNPP